MIYVIGIGPGSRDLMTQEAIAAMEDAEVIVGYKTYIKLVNREKYDYLVITGKINPNDNDIIIKF